MSTLSQFVGGSPIKSIQRGVISTGTNDSSATATISSVDTTKAIVNYLGSRLPINNTSAVVVNDFGNTLAHVALTNATTITITRGRAPGGGWGAINISYEVIEYN
jgi:hypothetical protein